MRLYQCDRCGQAMRHYNGITVESDSGLTFETYVDPDQDGPLHLCDSCWVGFDEFMGLFEGKKLVLDLGDGVDDE